jgi:toxin-antitoxin system PIN domain toxin
MKLIDANVLLYAVNKNAPHHDHARTWLDRALSGSEAVGFAWVVVLAFLRLSTRADLFRRPLAFEEAAGVVEAWLSAPPAVVAQPTTRHLELLRGLLQTTGAAANLVNDAHLAALALEHDASVVSYDRDFGRFGGVRHELPSAATT